MRDAYLAGTLFHDGISLQGLVNHCSFMMFNVLEELGKWDT